VNLRYSTKSEKKSTIIGAIVSFPLLVITIIYLFT
jgi:hypothetical protein